MRLTINQILVYSEASDKVYFTEFGPKLNVVHGRNTSGKSTLIQLILYAFGINDNKVKLAEILSEEVFVRVDCSIDKPKETTSLNYVFLRQQETLLIKDHNGKVLRFNGIGGDSSNEHIKLKGYLTKLFGFELNLESKSGVSQAPIETMFLPYYVSQDVGWVYLRKSFSNLTYYKNFKDDFLDYYLGIENATDREKKREIENEISRINQQIKFFTSVETSSESLTVSRIIDDTLTGKANILMSSLSTKHEELLELENKYVSESNNLSYLNKRYSVVSKVDRSQKNQEPGSHECPTCNQILPGQLDSFYVYHQSINDSSLLKTELKERIKQKQSQVNTINKKLEEVRKKIEVETRQFESYSTQNITLEKWIDNKSRLRLNTNLTSQVGELKFQLESKKEELSQYKTDQEIVSDRQIKSSTFKKLFLAYNHSLGLPELEERRFTNLYDISSLPFQGVQLHLALLSYHFAFNDLIKKTPEIHRFPFLLDSVFEGDADGINKSNILKFIVNHLPSDTQTMITIADSKKKDSKIKEYSSDILRNDAHLICIGNGLRQKALLTDNDNTKRDLILDSFEIIETE